MGINHITYAFDVEYQRRILALLIRDGTFFSTAMSDEVIQPAYFAEYTHQVIFQALRKCWVDYRQRPAGSTLFETIRQQLQDTAGGTMLPQIQQEITDVSALEVTDGKIIEKQVVAFAKEQALKNIITNAQLSPHINGEELVDNVRKVMAIGEGLENLGHVYKSHTYDRIIRRNKPDEIVVQTGLRQLDELMSGGLPNGRLGCIFGPAKHGKSVFLGNIAINGARIGKNVIYYTLEMSEEEVGNRLDANISHVSQNHLGKYPDHIVKAVTGIKGELIIRSLPAKRATTDTIYAHLQKLQTNCNFKPDVIIVDWAGLLRPMERYSEYRHTLSAIYAELKGICTDLKLPIWTAHHSRRSSYELKNKQEDREFLKAIEQEDLAECIDIAAHVDMLLSINWTEEEYQAGVARLFVANSRFTRMRVSLNFRMDLECCIVQDNALPSVPPTLMNGTSTPIL
jgi:replicative DNA helicase